MSFFKHLFKKNEQSANLTPSGDGGRKEDSTNFAPLGDGGVRHLEIKSKKLSNHLFTGEYHTAFKGVGMIFKEVKEYAAGDDIRFIDWNVSARMGTAYSKVFEEERELSVYILVDASASNLFGSGNQSKQELITEITALLAFSAANNNDKVGLLLCTDTVEKYIPPKKGREHILYMMKTLLSYKPKALKTDLSKALQYLNNNSQHKSIVFVLSDFVDRDYEQVLRITAKKHDLIGIKVYDKAEISLPKVGIVQVTDAETGETVWLDSENIPTRAAWKEQHIRTIIETEQYFKKASADLLQIATGEDYVKVLQQFFIKRK